MLLGLFVCRRREVEYSKSEIPWFVPATCALTRFIGEVLI